MCLQTGDATEEQAALARAQMGLPPPSMPAAAAAPVATQFLQVSGMVTAEVLADPEECGEVRPSPAEPHDEPRWGGSPAEPL